MKNPELEIDTFKINMNRISIFGIKDYLINNLNLTVEGIVQNGTNSNDFGYKKLNYNFPPTIGMVYYDHPQKGMNMGLKP